MKTTLSVTILIILGLVLPQHPIALVIPFSSKTLDYGSTTSQPDFPGPVSINQQLQQKIKYEKDLQKLLLFLNRPQFIYQLLRSYQKVPKEVKEAYFAKLG